MKTIWILIEQYDDGDQRVYAAYTSDKEAQEVRDKMEESGNYEHSKLKIESTTLYEFHN